jgi:dienelactone hydrolase
MIGSVVSHYRIISHIGAGGMGTVYLAEDTDLRRHLALKFLPSDKVSNSEAAARLLREARAASALDHPHIATIYEIGQYSGQPFIAMAYYEGQTLAARLAHGPMANAEVARVVAQIADALAAAHAAGIVHRDLKPSNVMLTTTGQVKVLDFGLAKVDTGETTAQLTEVGSTLGTAAYMSPEQASGELVDARSDLWSLGVVIHEMLAGRPLFTGTNALSIIHAVLTVTMVPVRTIRPDVAPELEEIVSRTLVRERDLRTIRASDVRDLASACHTRLASSGQQPAIARSRTSRRLVIAAAIVALLVAVGAVAWWAHRNAKVRWARQEALPEIVRLAGADAFDDAYALARQAQPYLADDQLFAEQMRAITRPATIDSDPPGASVYYRPYGRNQAPWRPLGKTPVAGVTVPRGLMHWKVQLGDDMVAEDVAPGPFSEPRLRFAMFRSTEVPPGMVRIVSSDRPVHPIIPSFEHLPGVHLPDYWIDRHEVTNRAFKRFVDDGGYRRPELWTHPFVENGRTLTFQAAMARFHDMTGRPGPAGWEMGAYAAGTDEYPVSGVSWYEAAAYAHWAGKSLPTIYHWTHAADPRLSADVVPASNFGGKSVLPVGASGGITRAGTADMAGNVKEWCLNDDGSKRYIMGGAWSEPAYMFNYGDADVPLARKETYGFRCIKLDRSEDLSPALTASIETPSRDVRAIKPVSEEVFEAWRSLYAIDHGNLQVRVESVDDSSPEWRVERVSYAAAYGDERIPAYLFLPKNAKPPYQVLIGFSGSNVFFERSSAATTDTDRFTFIMRSGRAFLYPVYKSTFERQDGVVDETPNMTVGFRDHMVMWAKDVRRSVDYLHSRSDIAKDKIGFIGLSTGAVLAPVFLAVEPRISLGVIYMGGLPLQPSLPEADAVNFAPRVKAKVLMLNGRFDYYFPTVSSQEPLFQLLGTPAAHKRRVVYEAGHIIPRNEMMKEVVNWMEKYWGPPTLP